MPRIIVASTNPVKIQAAQIAFTRMFPHLEFEIRGIATESGVSAQPLSLQETIQGALNRVEQASQQLPDADYWVGIEGGIQENPLSHEVMTFAWVAIKSRSGQIEQGSTGSFSLPPKMQKLIQQGLELGEVDDLVFGRHNSGRSNGAIGLLTEDVLTRADLCASGVTLALVPFKNQELWEE